jgi:paired amphipathic helix protein Sin3a
MGYRIDVSVDPADPNTITVTTPSGTTTQTTNILPSGTPVPSARLAPNATGSQPLPSSQPALYPGSTTSLVSNIVGVGGGTPGSRPMTPHAYPSGQPQQSHYVEPVYSPGLPTQNSQMTAAEHLNNLNNNGNKTVQVEKEFNHAIQYLNKIKARYADDPNTYKQFLDILQTYHKEQRHSHDVSFSAFSCVSYYI